jgi:isoprenylcysteine carboxyl methyltransferase (ICMT) family protein YpbQ
MESKLPFGKKNYQLMIIGVVVLMLGFIIMSIDKEMFGFGALGLIIGPIVVMAGFIIEIWAILHNPIEKK